MADRGRGERELDSRETKVVEDNAARDPEEVYWSRTDNYRLSKLLAPNFLSFCFKLQLATHGTIQLCFGPGLVNRFIFISNEQLLNNFLRL